MNIVKQTLLASVITTFALNTFISSTANAEINPFSTAELVTLVGNHSEAKCGEGKAKDAAKKAKCGEGKCGESKMKAAAKKGKCGEGKCGEGKKKDKKCGG